jgi:hypothetical protein
MEFEILAGSDGPRKAALGGPGEVLCGERQRRERSGKDRTARGFHTASITAA